MRNHTAGNVFWACGGTCVGRLGGERTDDSELPKRLLPPIHSWRRLQWGEPGPILPRATLTKLRRSISVVRHGRTIVPRSLGGSPYSIFELSNTEADQPLVDTLRPASIFSQDATRIRGLSIAPEWVKT